MALKKITDEELYENGVCSAKDVLTGTPAENKAVFDKMVSKLVAPAYNAAVDAINEINNTEKGIQTNESQRQTAENQRQTAESQRAAAENVRVSSEATRQANETVRQASENARNDYAAYDPAKSYVPGNKAAWQGSSYLCTVACTGTAPPDTAHWLLIAERGADGLNGRDGASIVADGLYGFDVDADTGELRLFYTGDTPPNFSISSDGHLIYTLDSGVSVVIGKVTGPAGPKGDTGDTGSQGPQGDPGITTMTQAAYDAAVAAGTIAADAWYGVFPEEG